MTTPRKPVPTPAEVRERATATGSHFFDKDAMRVFGDTMRNFATMRDELGRVILYRRRPTKRGAWTMQRCYVFSEVSGRICSEDVDDHRRMHAVLT